MPFGKFASSDLGKATATQKQRYSLLRCVQYFRVSKQWYGFQHINVIETARKPLAFLCRNLNSGSIRAKELPHKALVRSLLQCGSTERDPQTEKDTYIKDRDDSEGNCAFRPSGLQIDDPPPPPDPPFSLSVCLCHCLCFAFSSQPRRMSL